MKKQDKICLECGKTFSKYPETSYKVWNGVKFCSSRCSGLSRVGTPAWNKGVKTGVSWNRGKKGEYTFPIEKYPNAGMRNKKHTQEWKDNLSKKMMGNSYSKGQVGYMKGKHHTEETKRKLSLLAKNRIHPKIQTPIWEGRNYIC